MPRFIDYNIMHKNIRYIRYILLSAAIAYVMYYRRIHNNYIQYWIYIYLCINLCPKTQENRTINTVLRLFFKKKMVVPYSKVNLFQLNDCKWTVLLMEIDYSTYLLTYSCMHTLHFSWANTNITQLYSVPFQ